MTGFDVTVPAVQHTAATTTAIGSELRSELEALRAQADAVLTDAWLGRAAASFGRAWREWHTEAGQVIAALAELADALRATAISYFDGDDAGRTTLLLAVS
jgi:WXG100 family type VII secretion target